MATVALAAAGCASTSESRSGTREQLRDVQATLESFASDPQTTWLRENLPRSRAVVISPRFTRGALGVGAAAGKALAFAKDEQSARWRGPAFYNVTQASIGFQAGADVSEVLVLVMSEKGLDALLKPSLRLGVEASVAAGSASGGSTANSPSDMVTLARSKGAYAGLSFEGTVIRPDVDANRAFYGTPASAEDILVRGKVESSAAAPVQQSLLRMTQP
jgi:SH3 domain-containing YSC84-like protein 1